MSTEVRAFCEVVSEREVQKPEYLGISAEQ